MPLVAAAICPHPPLLVPAVATGAARELDSCRAACDRAVRGLVEAGPDLLVVVGAGRSEQLHGPGAWGSLAGVGCPVVAELDGPAAGPATLPLALTIGAWLLSRTGWAGLRLGLEVPNGSEPQRCRVLGEELARSVDRLGLLVMGDGSACRSERAPGYHDASAEAVDRGVATALATPDPAALLRLEPSQAGALLVAGRSAWQVLAGAAVASSAPLSGHLLYHDAPYGVGYLVASWWTGLL